VGAKYGGVPHRRHVEGWWVKQASLIKSDLWIQVLVCASCMAQEADMSLNIAVVHSLAPNVCSTFLDQSFRSKFKKCNIHWEPDCPWQMSGLSASY